MTVRQVRYTSRQHAETLTARPGMAVISITDPGMPEANLDPQFAHLLRLSFFDAVPADEYLPAPFPGLFDHLMARRISDFVREIHAAPQDFALTVHCEYGISRSAAVALFVAAYTGAPLAAREFAHDANTWVLDQLSSQHPGLRIDLPPVLPPGHERRAERRCD